MSSVDSSNSSSLMRSHEDLYDVHAANDVNLNTEPSTKLSVEHDLRVALTSDSSESVSSAASSHSMDDHRHDDHDQVVSLQIEAADRARRSTYDVVNYYDDDVRRSELHRRCPVKAVALAVVLLTVGLLCLGLSFWRMSDGESYMALLIIGCLLVVPGGYQTYQAVQAWRGIGNFEHLHQYELH